LQGLDIEDVRTVRHYLRQAITDRIAEGGVLPDAGEPGDAECYRRACVRLDQSDRRLIVGAVELGYSGQQLALAIGGLSAEAARGAARRTLLRLVAHMSGVPASAASVSRLALAVLDGDSIDWRQARQRAAESALPLVSALEVVARLADASRASPSVRQATRERQRSSGALFAVLLVALGAGQVVAAVFGYAAGVARPGPIAPPLAMAILLAFAAAAAWLGLGGRADARARSLAIFYLLVAGAFARRFLPGAAAAGIVALLRTSPDAFLATFLWRFAARFPRTVRYGRAERFCWWAERATLVAGCLLFVGSMFLELRLAPALDVLGRSHPAGVYWLIVLGASLPALPVAWWRGRMAAPDERRRLALFTLGLAAGLAPMLADIVVELAVPPVREFMGGHRDTQALIVGLFLLLTPSVTAYSVVVDRVLDVGVMAGRALRHLFARVTLTGVALLPFAMLAFYAYTHRAVSLSALLSSGRGAAAGAILAIGLAMWAARPRALAAIDRRFLGEAADLSRDLPRLAAQIRGVASRADLAQLLETRLGTILHVKQAHVLMRTASDDSFAATRGTVPDLPARSALAALVGAHAHPMSVGSLEPRSCFDLLPPSDQRWIEQAEASVVVPLIGSHDALVGLIASGPKRDQAAYTREDRSFLSSVAPAAALALEVLGGREQDEAGPAAECPVCGQVGTTVAEICACGGVRRAATLPAVVAGKFRVLNRVGAGGMGVVYRGQDLALNRAVALKTLLRLSPGARDALGGEARMMAAVIHPNLATIYSIERWRNTPVLVVEFLDGGTFSTRLRSGPLPVGDVLHLGSVLASALRHLHENRILHRDVKPSNIGFSGGGVPKLLDFGLASFVSAPREAAPASDSDVTRLLETQTMSVGGRVIAGTPLYLSPEAAQGEDPNPDFDLWALSVVLYEAIAGTHPFKGPTIFDVLENVRTVRVQDLRQFRPDCPEAVARAFASMLSPDRALRPPTARVLHDVLDRLVREEARDA